MKTVRLKTRILKPLFTFILLFFFSLSFAQPYSAYVDIRNEFYVFDNGSIQKLEPLMPIEYKIGRYGLAYMDNERNFKIYRDGLVQKVSEMFTTSFQVSDYLIAYQSAAMVKVIDGNEVNMLAAICKNYILGDSIVLFYDDNRSSFSSYYKGKITELETFLNLNEDDFSFGNTVKASDNIGAYINYNDAFKVIYQGEVEQLESQRVKSFQVGRNTVAYVDINNQFKIYFKGELYTVDGFAPKSFQVGDDLVAFQGYDGYFKIFYEGQLINLGYYEPPYRVEDYVVAYADMNGYFYIFHKGKQQYIDNFYPEGIIMDYNSLAYVNRSNILRFFSNGEIKDVSAAPTSDVRIDYDILQFKTGFNNFKIFYNGMAY